MTETAITAIETMYRKNIKFSEVAELTKLTGLSRGFFYNNPNVKQVMMELKEKQQGMILRNPKSDAIAIYDEKNGLTYMLCGDYYLPELALTDIEPTYGKYEMLRKKAIFMNTESKNIKYC